MDFSTLMKNIEVKFNHIKKAPELISPHAITKFTDIALTCNGTCGIEYPSFGIRCIVAENSYYTHAGFSIVPKNIFEYKKILKNINQIKKLKKNVINRAKIFTFIANSLVKTKATFLPDHMPIFESRMESIDEDEYWKQSIVKLKKFNLINDPFKIMFEKQIQLELRHTIDHSIFSIKNKKLYDY